MIFEHRSGLLLNSLAYWALNMKKEVGQGRREVGRRREVSRKMKK